MNFQIALANDNATLEFVLAIWKNVDLIPKCQAMKWPICKISIISFWRLRSCSPGFSSPATSFKWLHLGLDMGGSFHTVARGDSHLRHDRCVSSSKSGLLAFHAPSVVTTDRGRQLTCPPSLILCDFSASSTFAQRHTILLQIEWLNDFADN